MALAPIIFFVFNRPHHTQRALASLAKAALASESDLYIVCDGPRTEQDLPLIQQTRDVVDRAQGFKSVNVIKSEVNRGLANSVIGGVTGIITGSRRAIVVEDDLVVSPYFLKFLNEGLERYQDEARVFSVSAYHHPPSLVPIPNDYSYDAYANPRNSSWGWATWADRWDRVDWEVRNYRSFIDDPLKVAEFNRGGEDLTPMLRMQMTGDIDSWSIRFSYAHYQHRAVSMVATRSYVENIGLDGSGTHSSATDDYHNDLSLAPEHPRFPPAELNCPEIVASFRKVYQCASVKKPSFLQRAWSKINRLTRG